MTNEPVLNNGAIAAIMLLAGPWLARWGIDAGGAQEVLGIGATVVGGLIAIWRFVAARGKVTPVANPNLPAIAPDVIVPPA